MPLHQPHPGTFANTQKKTAFWGDAIVIFTPANFYNVYCILQRCRWYRWSKLQRCRWHRWLLLYRCRWHRWRITSPVSLTPVRQCKTQIYYNSGVIDTGLVILTGVNDTTSVCLIGVLDTGKAPKIANISTSFRKNSKIFSLTVSAKEGPDPWRKKIIKNLVAHSF